MSASLDLAGLRERVRDALSMVEVATFDGVQLRLANGRNMGDGRCPFHEEKSASFRAGGKWRDRFHCFGCGEDGDIFDYWAKRRGCDHLEAVKQLAGLAGIYVGDIRFEKPKAGVVPYVERRLDVVESLPKKPSLPSLARPNRAACELIAAKRGLDANAVWLAARVFHRVGYCLWPQYESGGRWRPREDAVPSWAAIDRTRNVAEFRRLDNERYARADGTLIKAWSTAGKAWPLGCEEARKVRCVLLVEGGPDMLAAYHFLLRWGMAQKVAVVCMLGASNKIREDALGCFAGCRVRIVMDADAPKDAEVKGKRKLPGLEAAVRWQAQLQAAGAAVMTFCVGDVYEPESLKAWYRGEIQAAEMVVQVPGYVKRDGTRVKDLNDLVFCDDSVLGSADVRAVFRWWDF